MELLHYMHLYCALVYAIVHVVLPLEIATQSEKEQSNLIP